MPEVLGTDPGRGISGFGTTLEGVTTGPIGMIQRINIPGADINDIDVTTMNAPGRWMLFVAGLKDAKEFSIELVYHKTNMAAILTAFGAANENWTIKFPDNSTYVVSGYIKNLGTQIPHNDKISQSVTIRLSGPPVFSASSGA